MFFLTHREQSVIIAILIAFLVGLGVKEYRSTHSISKKTPHSSTF
ncbi:MAG: hypothetical protein QE493_07765 [Verrucomicrobiae bacterium]|nr:hypothetical protein [Verrucomicrobiae bacterium]